MNKKNIKCFNCNLPIYPPKLPEGLVIKDKFDQIRCLGCGKINDYSQSQWYESQQNQTKNSEWWENWYFYLLGLGIIIGVCDSIGL